MRWKNWNVRLTGGRSFGSGAASRSPVTGLRVSLCARKLSMPGISGPMTSSFFSSTQPKSVSGAFGVVS